MFAGLRRGVGTEMTPLSLERRRRLALYTPLETWQNGSGDVERLHPKVQSALRRGDLGVWAGSSSRPFSHSPTPLAPQLLYLSVHLLQRLPQHFL